MVGCLKKTPKGQIVVLHVASCIIQLWKSDLRWCYVSIQEGEVGLMWDEAGSGTEGMTGLDIYVVKSSSSSQCKRMTECKRAEQDPSALTRIEGTFFLSWFMLEMALFLAKKTSEVAEARTEKAKRVDCPFLRIWLVLIITVEDLNFHGYSSLSWGFRLK